MNKKTSEERKFEKKLKREVEQMEQKLWAMQTDKAYLEGKVEGLQDCIHLITGTEIHRPEKIMLRPATRLEIANNER